MCPICGQAIDDAEHAVLVCDAWESWRREVCAYLGIAELTTSNIVPTMLQSKYNWDEISEMIKRIMRRREAEERQRQRTAPVRTHESSLINYLLWTEVQILEDRASLLY